MSDASHDERIRARIEAAADTMPDAPVRWERVASLARRKLLISVLAALALAVLAAVLLAYAGSYSSLKLTGTAPIALPGLAHKQLSADRTRPRERPTSGANGEPTSGTPGGHPAAGKVPDVNKGAGKGNAEPKEITLSLSATSVPANGTATVTVTARVLNATGKPLGGQDVRFYSTDQIAERASQASGVYVATITSSTKAGPVTVEARDATVIAQAVLQQTPVEPTNPCSKKEGEAGTTTAGSTVSTTGTTPTTGITPTTSTGSTVGTSSTTATTPPCGTSTKATTNGTSTNGTSTSGSGTATQGTSTQGTSTQGTGTQGTTTGTNTHETGTTKSGAGTSRQSGAGGESAQVG